MSRLSIRQKLLVVLGLLTSLAVVALFLLAGRQLAEMTLAFYQRDAQTAVLTAASNLSAFMGEDESVDMDALQRTMGRLRSSTDQELILLDTHLRVLAGTGAGELPDSLPMTPDLSSALDRRSVVDIRSGANGQPTIYTAAPLLHDEEVVALLRLAAPLQPAYDESYQNWLRLAGGALPVLFVAVLASLWLGQAITRPIRQLHASALRVAEGALDERVEVNSHDEIGQLGQAFNFMAERLNTLLSAQRSFISNAAHELRTPLMSLKLRSEALQDEALPEAERRVYLEEIQSEIVRMTALINQLLNLARLDEGRSPARPEVFDTAALLQDAARHWRIQAQASQVELEVVIPEALPDTEIASGDLRTVLDNLLGNAVKYTPKGGRVTLRAAGDSRALRLQVSDTGEGFAREDAARLFERFFRADRSRSRQIPGTGLGLAIVQAIVEQCGGSVSSHSAGPGQGATFEVTLPLRNGHP